jgi:hypothetical protein
MSEMQSRRLFLRRASPARITTTGPSQQSQGRWVSGNSKAKRVRWLGRGSAGRRDGSHSSATE